MTIPPRKRGHRIGRSIAILLCGLCAAHTASADALKLEVMAFNLRYASDQPPNAWPDRRPVVAEVFNQVQPDIVGTQEGVFRQIKDIDTDLPAYDWVGLGREGGSRGEFCAIFYKHEKFEVVAFDHFWLSATPEIIGSITWDHKHHRMATWAHFRERSTGHEFVVLNTHFDHRSELARKNSAALICDRIEQFDAELPLIVVGDFNCLAGDSEPFEILTTNSGLIDTWAMAFSRGPIPTLNTFHGYNSHKFEDRRIDWVLARNPSEVRRARIITTQTDGQFPSDHFPVTATIEFSK